MSERKNLDKLFQEKFKDFEAMAPEQSWPYIEEQLKKKKKRRVIPFWWQLSGVAAALIIGFLIYKNWGEYKTGDQNRSEVVVQDPDAPSQNKSDDSFGTHRKETAVTQNENSAGQNQTDAHLKNNAAENNKTTANSVNRIAPTEREAIAVTANENVKLSENRSEETQRNQNLKSASIEKGVANSSSKSEKAKKGNRNKKQNSLGIQHEENRLAVNVRGKKHGRSDNKKTATLPGENSKNNSIASDNKNSDNTAIAQTNKDSKSEASPQQQTNPNHTAIVAATNKSTDKKADSTAIATVVPNALEELLNEKENNLVTKGPQLNRWQITSSVAPIYFGSTSGGSPIDSSFASNSKSYKTNMSVKLGVNYAINKKLSIRTGISQVTFDYNTNDVMMSAGMQARTMGNVDPSAESQYLHFARKIPGKRVSNENLVAAANELSTDKFQSYLNQRMGYIEVPLEVSYAVIDKKFGVNVIGGVSTLFLNENKILVVSDGLSTNLGEANNLSKTHFSTNIGLGLRYRFYKAFQANFEPMFKYQINTFSKDNGNFKPYYLGLYTGVSYSF